MATHHTQIALLLLTMYPDRASPGLATGRTVQVGAKCMLRVHRYSPIDMRGILTSNRRARGPVTRHSSVLDCLDHGSLRRYLRWREVKEIPIPAEMISS